MTTQLAKRAIHLREQSHLGEPSKSTYISCTREREIEENGNGKWMSYQQVRVWRNFYGVRNEQTAVVL